MQWFYFFLEPAKQMLLTRIHLPIACWTFPCLVLCTLVSRQARSYVLGRCGAWHGYLGELLRRTLCGYGLGHYLQLQILALMSAALFTLDERVAP